MNFLTLEGCRSRQTRLRAVMRERNLDSVLLCESRYVHYFTGFWLKNHQFTAVLITPDTVQLSTPYGTDYAAAETVDTYESNKQATLVDDRRHVVLIPFAGKLTGRVGCDGAVPYDVVANRTDICADLRTMRRTKETDEVSLIRHAVAGTEAAYAKARELLAPGVSEVHIYAQMLAAATEFLAEPLGEMGNDFQSGGGGGAPRARGVEDGELMPLDVSVWLRGYSCDLCRTFAVKSISDAQQEANDAVNAALRFVESQVKPGVNCRELHLSVEGLLNTSDRWNFPHHLGHGIGLAPHEAPRLNPNWNDTFQVGDVFTAEPGVYGKELKTGIRIENDYLVTETGVECLSFFPTGL